MIVKGSFLHDKRALASTSYFIPCHFPDKRMGVLAKHPAVRRYPKNVITAALMFIWRSLLLLEETDQELGG